MVGIRDGFEIPNRTIFNDKDGLPLVFIPEGELLVGKDKICHIPAFYLALHPITNLQYKVFTRETGHRLPFQGPDYYPVVGVSWDDAQAYCLWAGLRLPNSREWLKGATGTDGRTFPWGNDWSGGRKCRNSVVVKSDGICSVWQYPEGVSPYGLLQMAGNIEEWCEDTIDEGSSDRITRGGSSNNVNEDAFKSAFVRWWGPSFKAGSIGFRCAKDA